jgi:hypothetical protein
VEKIRAAKRFRGVAFALQDGATGTRNFPDSGLVEWLSWEETETHYILRHASGFQFLHVPKWALRGDVGWNTSEQLFEWKAV